MNVSADVLFEAAVDAAWAQATSVDIDAPRVGVTTACSSECDSRYTCMACDRPTCDDHHDVGDPGCDTEPLYCPSNGVLHHGCHTQVCLDVSCWTDV